jgi:DNA (cytosine-5)-methyltransferase 1
MGRRKPTFASLFSGCGGFDLGFVQAGFRCVGAFDIDVDAISVYRTNLSGKATACDLAAQTTLKVSSPADVVLAGPPCQGFSTAGKRRLNDPRNSLLVKAADMAVRLRPRAIVIENVAGVIAGSHRKYWRKMLNVLRDGDYQTVELRCDATDFGLSQLRSRVVCLAWNTSFDGNVQLPKTPGGTLRDAIGYINGAANHHRQILGSHTTAATIAEHIKPGEKLSNVRASSRAVHTWNIPSVYGRTNRNQRSVLNGLLRRRRRQRVRAFGDADPVSAHALCRFLGRPVATTLHELIEKQFVRRVGNKYDLCHTFNGKFRRLAWEQPSPTVDTKFGNALYFLHPDEHRGFTVREAARLQGFPDKFVFSGPLASQFRMIGNAVPPPLAKTLALFISERVL